MKKNNERRSITRCIANCQCWIEQEAVTLFGTVTNLSSKGLFLQTLPILECGTEIDIRLSFQDIGDLLARGRVCWKSSSHAELSATERPSKVPGLGIEFCQIKQGRELLPQYISKRSVAPPALENKKKL